MFFVPLSLPSKPSATDVGVVAPPTYQTDMATLLAKECPCQERYTIDIMYREL